MKRKRRDTVDGWSDLRLATGWILTVGSIAAVFYGAYLLLKMYG